MVTEGRKFRHSEMSTLGRKKKTKLSQLSIPLLENA